MNTKIINRIVNILNESKLTSEEAKDILKIIGMKINVSVANTILCLDQSSENNYGLF